MVSPVGARSAFTGLFSTFMARCHATNLATGTIAWYEQILRNLSEFLTASNVHSAAEIRSAHLRDYLAHLRQRGLSSETVFRTWGALKCTFKFLAGDNLLPSNPMHTVERPKRERHLIKPFNMEQVRRLLAQPDKATSQGTRDYAMILLMVDSGLRISEILGLECERINFQEGILTVLGKGRKERYVPIGHTSRKALLHYSDLRGPGGNFFFIGRTGRPLQRRYIQTKLREFGRNAELTGVRVSPHTLRHTFAIQYIKNGGDPFSLQAILGHSTLEMVRNYVNLARQDISEQHRKFSPMDFVPPAAVNTPQAGVGQRMLGKFARLEASRSEMPR